MALMRPIHNLALAATLVISTTSCSIFSPPELYTHPYFDAEVLIAEKFVTELRYLEWSELQKHCGIRFWESKVIGCVDKDGRVALLLEDLELGMRRSYLHELGHLYEYKLLGVSWMNTVEHKDWTVVLRLKQWQN